MNCVFKTTKYSFASGNLFLGNIYAANDKELLRRNKIGAVLSVIDTSNVSLEPSIKRLVKSFHLNKYN
jgi:atypical dual specificity phosphatase